MQRLNPRSDASGLERAGLLTDAPTYRGGSQHGIFFVIYIRNISSHMIPNIISCMIQSNLLYKYKYINTTKN